MSAHTEALGITTPTRSEGGLPVKRLAMVGLGLAILLALAIFGFRYWTFGRFIEGTDDAYVGGDVTAMSPHVPGFIAAMVSPLAKPRLLWSAGGARRFRRLMARPP